MFGFRINKSLLIFNWSALFWCYFTLGPCFAESGFEAALKATFFNHPSIAGKDAEVNARLYEISAINGQKFPTVSIDANAYDGRQASANLQVKQPLLTFGRISAELKLSRAKSEVEKAELFDLKRNLLEQTAIAYVEVTGAINNKVIAEDYLNTLIELRDKVKRREVGQLATKADVVLVEARLVQAKGQLAKYKGELARRENDLLMLTQKTIDCTTEVSDAWFAKGDLGTLKEEIVNMSSEITVKSRMLDLAQAEREMQVKADRPTLYLRADKPLSKNVGSSTPTVGIFLETDFSGFGKIRKGHVNAAQARVDAALQDINSTKVNLIGRVKGLVHNRNQAKQLLSELKASVGAIEDLLKSYERQYQAGNKSWLDLINMRREYHDQKLQQNLANIEWMKSSLTLSALSGDLDVVVILK